VFFGIVTRMLRTDHGPRNFDALCAARALRTDVRDVPGTRGKTSRLGGEAHP
jgi:hypothetical protein